MTQSVESELHAPVPGVVKVLRIDDEIVALDKPAGLAVTPERTATAAAGPADTLTNRLWHHLAELAPGGDVAAARPFIVHRLDREVSGVIVYARTAAAHKHLSQQFEAHSVRKTYWGIVAGLLEPAAGEIAVPIGPLPKPNHRTRGKIFANAPGAKAALTRYRTVEPLLQHAVVELQPQTGRRHQLRVHLSAQGCPLVGDRLYGKKEPLAEWPAALAAAGHPARVALHAVRLRLLHPKDGREVEYMAPLPPALEMLLDQLRTSGNLPSNPLNL